MMMTPLGPDEGAIVGYLGVSGIARAFVENNWTKAEETGILIDIARNSENAASRIAAIRQINRSARDAATLNGLVVTNHARATRRDNRGNSLHLQSAQTKLINLTQSENTQPLTYGGDPDDCDESIQFSSSVQHIPAENAPSDCGQAKRPTTETARRRVARRAIPCDPDLADRIASDACNRTPTPASRRDSHDKH